MQGEWLCEQSCTLTRSENGMLGAFSKKTMTRHEWVCSGHAEPSVAARVRPPSAPCIFTLTSSPASNRPAGWLQTSPRPWTHCVSLPTRAPRTAARRRPRACPDSVARRIGPRATAVTVSRAAPLAAGSRGLATIARYISARAADGKLSAAAAAAADNEQTARAGFHAVHPPRGALLSTAGSAAATPVSSRCPHGSRMLGMYGAGECLHVEACQHCPLAGMAS
eukprot:358723-Chlamydomonas_euryale.AAC.2